jgi:hypothetical protein
MEADDPNSFIAGLLAAAAAGTMSDISTVRAWTGAEFKVAAEKASKAASAIGLPASTKSMTAPLGARGRSH